MIALDTNALIRLLVADDKVQHEAIVGLIERGTEAGETFFVGDVVLAELCWVLTARYRFDRDAIAFALKALLSTEALRFESDSRCQAALRQFVAGKAGYADYLIVARASEAECRAVATFDRALAAEEGCAHPASL